MAQHRPGLRAGSGASPGKRFERRELSGTAGVVDLPESLLPHPLKTVDAEVHELHALRTALAGGKTPRRGELR
jgi:hypothetical protein